MFEDGWVACRVVESDRQTDSGWFLHWNGDGDQPGHDWRNQAPRYEAPRPPDPVVDEALSSRTYQALLTRCPLTDEHRQGLRHRGMTDAEIDHDGYGSLPELGRAELTAAIMADIGADITGAVPGFYLYQDTPTLRGLAGLLIPVRDSLGRVRRLRLSPDDPVKRAEGKYRWISSSNLPGGIGSGVRAHIAYPTTIATAYHRIGLTEGELKAAIAARKTGMPFLSMPGVGAISALRKSIAGLRKLGVREVVIAFDTDAETNPMVASGLNRAVDLLEAEGFAVVHATWPAEFKGIDDALFAGILPMVERRISVDHADIFAENDRLKAENAELRAKLAGQAGEHAAYVQAQKAPHLGPERQVAAAVINSLSAARAKDGDKWIRMPYKKVAEAAGVSERAVPRHFDKLKKVWGNHVELKTEWVPDLGHNMTFARLMTEGRDALLAVATAPPSENGSKNGNGGRRVCKVCGDAGIKRITTDYCLGCGAELDSRESIVAGTGQTVVNHPEPPEPDHDDSLSGCPLPPPSAPTNKRSPLDTLLSPAKVATYHNHGHRDGYAPPAGGPGFDRWTQ